ncbi:hypothetical protein POM88_016521 [Heracleum sosnowskyi]|uniref:TIR domain-containing protein n=1 Tax=Heracleum sosnowskyi TaxID=360622 RepID=A0AAD8INJ2_9APIA|nr:hypothetical protein POM88_016521 [Heracleum sosnowskyi]
MAKEASFCHVFLSFKGETRNNFTCFLYEALKAQGFVAFMDKSDINVGDEVDLTIREGIRNSMSAIIIFSQKYAYSTWCLDELVLILERKKNSRYFVMPIFYEVEIRDIRHQLGNYDLALEKHRVKHSHKVEKWREALVEASNIFGDHVEGLQSTFIQNTVKLFQEKLAAKFPESRLPMSKSTVHVGSLSSSFFGHGPSNDNVILYTTSVNNGLGANGLVKTILMGGNVLFEERNCSKEPKYLTELQELVGNDNVRFPMVIVNGKDLCGEEEVEGLEDFQGIVKLKSTLNILYSGQRQLENINNYMKTTSSILDFTGHNQAWGGSLYASEFVRPKIVTKPQSLGGLKLLCPSDNETDWGGGLYASQFVGSMKVAKPQDLGGLKLFNSSEIDWGGGLYAPEFVRPKKVAKPQGLGGIELLHSGEADWGGGLNASEFVGPQKLAKPH